MQAGRREGLRHSDCYGKPLSARLSGLTIGALTLTPEFDPDTTEYAATATNATNKVTATPEDEDAELTIMVGDTEIDNEDSATWEEGENTLTVTVVNGEETETYTVTVTKTTQSPPAEG